MIKVQDRILEIMKLAPVVPVLVIDDINAAVLLARALVAGGLPAIEVTLRTPSALDCIAAISAGVEGAIVGAGTVLNADHMEQAINAGSKFLVSPGATQELIDASKRSNVPLLPGVATASEAMGLAEEGITALKFFPANHAGGAGYIKALSSPLPHITFCPTGGINADNAGEYLSLPNVACVGGSWVAPKELIERGDWAGITALAKAASELAH
jgi:2-dehydro-3-deoxyphosphogluconate aldolase/(4S)-4-hydroxy-2-oxoglutarate aldolase